MSWKMINDATEVIYHDVRSICYQILDAHNLPAWNPAISSVEASDCTGVFLISVRGLLKGTLTYAQPNPRTINMSMSLPGLTEESTFTLSPQPGGTRVTHTISQWGLLAAIIGRTEVSLVPAKRLARLARYLDKLCDGRNASIG